ncbi:DEAD/DEAH-box-containing ATP-dependent RNA helicase [Skeletonema marinoi]|uniref:RNA helicase n=1 Tax=Skeletonema marinoi TaxID=267567 RepID=A0AAD9DAD1_9STRA|nr:DEAD/DEAH-box-containing ATP-dependent RNA helicase [Skeletonema marinoi]
MATINQFPASTMLAAIILALAASSSNGFTTISSSSHLPKFSSGHTSSTSTSTSPRHTSLLVMAAAQNKKGGQQKKRRFVQHIHPDATPSQPQQQQQKPRPKVVQSDDGGATSNLDSLASNKNTSGSGGSKSTERRGNKRIGPPLQTSKSIEDLEAILEKRWGTASAQESKSSRGGGGGDTDFVLSFGNDDDVYDDDTPVVKGAAVLKGATATAAFRSKRVVDPWAEEEGIYDSVGDEKKKTNIEDINNEGMAKKQQQRYNKQDALLNRVRANQDRLQTKRGGISRGDGNKTFDVPVDISRDFYDEDDEGYESGPRQRKSSLISPKPAGGKGSMKSSSQPASTSSLAGGIFSGRSVDEEPRGKTKDSSDLEEMEEKKKKPKRKEPQLKPLLDEDGNEMFLTLEQAEKIVQNILSSKEDGDDDSESEDLSESNAEWEDIGITDATLLSNLQSSKMSCVTPLPVQEKSCPPILVGNDVLVSTHTGSGKTLSFLAPIAQSLLMDTNNIKGSSAFPKAIIVAPGRELASQIVSVGQNLFAGTDLTISLAIGGTPFARNVDNLRKRKPDIVVGTPGRIAELVLGRAGERKGKMNISGVQTIVLDEFDALLQYDVHKEPTVAIMEAMDRQHGESLQRVLCSATALDMMGEKQGGNNVETYLRPGYAHASVDESDVLVTTGVTSKAKGQTKTSPRVSRTTIHGALHVPHQRFALDAVRKILNTDPLPQQALIFVDSPRRADIVIEKLAKMDIIAAPLHGGSTSGKGDRAEVNKALREGYVGCVVCTEIAARGIDAPYLTHVINLDLPTDSSHYAHRAGRCGRGGRPGVSVSITCDGREKGVPRRLAEELGITMHNVEARGGKLRIVEN